MHSCAVATWLRSGQVAISGMGNCTNPQHLFYKKWPGGIDPQNFGLTSNGLIAEQRFWGANSRIVFAFVRIFKRVLFLEFDDIKNKLPWHLRDVGLQPSEVGQAGQVEVFSPWLAREDQIREDRNVCRLVWLRASLFSVDIIFLTLGEFL